MSRTVHRTFARDLASGAVFLAMAAAAAGVFLYAFAPRRMPARTAETRGYPVSPVDEALSPERVRAKLDAVLAQGSRYPGQPGFRATESMLRAAYAGAGLRVIELPHHAPAPVTRERTILDAASGAALDGVEIYPYMPNHFQPIVTPADGLDGELVLITDDVLRTRPSFTGCVAVVDLGAPPKDFGTDWVKYAQLGACALVVTHRDGMQAVRWGDAQVCASLPANYPRLFATEGILAQIGKRVRLRVRVDWQDVVSTTFVGILPAAQTNREAVVSTACYDACALLPDLAPGVLGAGGLAAQLALLEAVPEIRKSPLQRDLVFVAYSSQMMGQMGADRLTAVVGGAHDRDAAGQAWAVRREANAREAAAVRACATAIDAPGFLSDAAATDRALAGLARADRAVLDEQLRYVLNSLIGDLSEAVLQARLRFLRSGEDPKGPEYAAYREAKGRYDAALAVAGYPLHKLMEPAGGLEKGPPATRYGVQVRLQSRFAELIRFHEARAVELDAAMAVHTALRPYSRLVPVGTMFMPKPADSAPGEAFSFYIGSEQERLNYVNSPIVGDVIQGVVQRLPLPANARFDGLRTRGHDAWANGCVDGLQLDSRQWNGKGFPGFCLINSDRGDVYKLIGAPVELPYMRDMAGVATGLRVFGRAVLALAHGQGAFEEPRRFGMQHYSGRVFVSGIGRSIVPNHPLAGALLGDKGQAWTHTAPGYYNHPFFHADVYGRYDLPFCTAAIVAGAQGYNPQAVAFGPDGLIRYIKDEGPQGQAVYKSMNFGWFSTRSGVNIVVFRTAPVSVLDMVNPQTLKAFNGASFLTSSGVAPVTRHNIFAAGDVVTAFLEPDRRVFVALRAGAPDNPLVQETRAFALNVPPGFQAHEDREIDGAGFLPADTPVIGNLCRDVVRSMLLVNGRRLELQDRHGMADDRTREFQQRSAATLERSADRALPRRTVTVMERDAATYAILNHPVLRESINEAVVGILWYLGLLVPFVFFFERLAFGFADIRRQLAAQAGVFLVVFILLRLLHPAFLMIRSSTMILLGFVILLISGGVTLLLSGKMKENLEELRKQRGQVSAADVNALGVMATAFSLGLNNMHRRIVRTGLTCATLVLLTFAMICFTSVQSRVVNSLVAVGKAWYQGFLVKREKMAPISDGEYFALRTKYGDRFAVSPRRMLVGEVTWERIQFNPEIEAVCEVPGREPRRTEVASIMTFAADDPLRDRIDIVSGPGWFPAATDVNKGEPAPVLLPERLAGELGVGADDIGAAGVELRINGKTVKVHGIFRASSLADLRDLDGRDLLPFDVESITSIRSEGGSVVVEEDDPRLQADRIVIGPEGFIGQLSVPHGRQRIASVAVAMPGVAYPDARAAADQYLEQTGAPTYLGLDETAYRGQRARVRSFAGMIEMLVPLLIAAMTVLNTMRGSVYERREEIFVYNAVGIAPRYIFGMFLSEAFVYAVVGCVLGYILSQGTGRVLSALGWTGGLNMTFTSITTIYASLAIMAAVFLSTLFPARTAMRISAPAEESGWKLPEPEGDRMAFALPFTFDATARVAVLAFFNRYFNDHGEGGGGPFHAGVPRAGVEDDPVDAGAYAPTLTTIVWLKPFDLGVSQELTISMPRDRETGEFIASVVLRRMTGTRESWVRLNAHFIQRVRQHFLYWRAVGPKQRAELFAEARSLMEGRG